MYWVYTIFAQVLIAINGCTTLRNGNLIGNDAVKKKIFCKMLIAINPGYVNFHRVNVRA